MKPQTFIDQIKKDMANYYHILYSYLNLSYTVSNRLHTCNIKISILYTPKRHLISVYLIFLDFVYNSNAWGKQWYIWYVWLSVIINSYVKKKKEKKIRKMYVFWNYLILISYRLSTQTLVSSLGPRTTTSFFFCSSKLVYCMNSK